MMTLGKIHVKSIYSASSQYLNNFNSYPKYLAIKLTMQKSNKIVANRAVKCTKHLAHRAATKLTESSKTS